MHFYFDKARDCQTRYLRFERQRNLVLCENVFCDRSGTEQKLPSGHPQKRLQYRIGFSNCLAVKLKLSRNTQKRDFISLTLLTLQT